METKSEFERGQPFWCTGVLAFIGGLQFGDEFDVDELVKYFVVAARFKQAIFLCRAIDLDEKTAGYKIVLI